MANKLKESLIDKFEKLLKDPTCVCVENFYEKMEEANNNLVWSDKNIKWDNFHGIFKEYNPKELELYIEGYRCLTQIHINLLKDFDIFKIYPIRKYSSAYNYISKIHDYEKLLKAIDYKLIENEKKYKLKEDLKELENSDEARETALKLLICFMELSEMIKLRYDMCEIQDLISQREKNIKKHCEELEIKEMSDEDKLKKFEKCEICENNMDMIKGECEVCQYSVADFSFSYKFKDLLESRYNVKIKVPNYEMGGDEKGKPDSPTKLEPPKRSSQKNERKEDKSNDKWSCIQCTFLNESASLNCIICESKRPQ